MACWPGAIATGKVALQARLYQAQSSSNDVKENTAGRTLLVRNGRQTDLKDQEAIGFTVAVEGRVRGVGGGGRDVGVDLHLQLGLEAGHERPMLLHICSQHHLNHHLPQLHLDNSAVHISDRAHHTAQDS